MAALRRLVHERTGLAICESEGKVEVDVNTVDDVTRWVAWGSYGESIRLKVPASNLVMQGALKFGDSSHPFVAALSQGKEALGHYYASRTPMSLCDLHSIAQASAADLRVPAWEVPWIQRVKRAAPPGECGLGPEHGVSFYGPVSPRKLALEHQRLTEIRDQIATKGYQPDLYGDINGYFMCDERGGFRFFVRGGKHRAAVLAHLGWSKIPVVFKQDWPRAIWLEHASFWPMVSNGTLSEQAAKAVFLAYFGRDGNENDC